MLHRRLALGLIAAGTMLLAFFPPRSYLVWLERSCEGATGWLQAAPRRRYLVMLVVSVAGTRGARHAAIW